MKKYLLILCLVIACNTGNSQNLANTKWLGTNAPSPNLWFLFGTDTLYYSFTNSGFTPLSKYTASNAYFDIFDLPGTSLCTDTGYYNYAIINPNLIFSLISDLCSSRRNTFLNYNWIQIASGADQMSELSEVNIYQNPGEGYIIISLPDQIIGRKEISLFDVSGKLVYHEIFEENKINVDMSFLSKGLFVGRILNDAINKSFVIVR